jgi:hypothetical protein
MSYYLGMSQDLVIAPARVSLTSGSELVLPRLIAAAGDGAARRFLEFFAATISNRNTRAAYGRAREPAGRFTWTSR